MADFPETLPSGPADTETAGQSRQPADDFGTRAASSHRGNTLRTVPANCLYTADDTIVADLIDQTITWLCSGKALDLSEDRDSYQQKELKHFVDIMYRRIESDNSIEAACKELRIARGVE